MDYVEKTRASLKDLRVLFNIDFWFMTIFAAFTLVGIVDLLNSPHEWVRAVIAFITVVLLVDRFAPRFIK